MKYMSKEEQKDFWLRHVESHRKMDKDFANLPHDKQLVIMQNMRANHEAMRRAKPIIRKEE